MYFEIDIEFILVWFFRLFQIFKETRQSKQCGFSIYTFDNLKSKSMVRLVREDIN